MTNYLEVAPIVVLDSGVIPQTTLVTVLNNGNYAIISNRILRVFSPDGTQIGSDRASTGQDLTALDTGGFVVVSSANGGAVARTFDNDGNVTSTVFSVDSHGTTFPVELHVAAIPGGGFVVTWEGDVWPEDKAAHPSGGAVYSQVIDASNQFAGNAQPVFFKGTSIGGDVAVLTDGSIVYTVAMLNAAGAPAKSGQNVYVIHQATDGTLSSLIAPELTFTGDQIYPSIVALAAGGYAVAWMSGGSSYFTVYNTHDQPIQQEIPLSTIAPGIFPSLAAMPDGGFVAAWSSDKKIVTRTFDSHGHATGGEILADDDLDSWQDEAPHIAAGQDGSYVTTWPGVRSYPDNDQDFPVKLEARVWHATDNLDGSQVFSGTSVANVFNGGGGDDRIEGGGGNDTLDGGMGNDTLVYYFAPSGVTVSLAMDGVAQHTGGEGTDTVYNFENLVGSAFNDTLRGNAVANIIYGGEGADTMYGGAGDDTYYVDSASDVVSEQTVSGVDDGGTDIVIASSSFTLGLYIENLTLTGGGTGIGNDLNNIILGGEGFNSLRGLGGDDVLDGGGAGNDSLRGGAGNDTYYVDGNDAVSEETVINVDDGGIDLVIASSGFTLPKFVENLTLTGSAIGGAGNALDNILTGDAIGNHLDGMTGADIMRGGAGNDTYVVDNASDIVDETFFTGTDDGGIDLVQSSINYTLGGPSRT